MRFIAFLTICNLLLIDQIMMPSAHQGTGLVSGRDTEQDSHTGFPERHGGLNHRFNPDGTLDMGTWKSEIDPTTGKKSLVYVPYKPDPRMQPPPLFDDPSIAQARPLFDPVANAIIFCHNCAKNKTTGDWDLCAQCHASQVMP